MKRILSVFLVVLLTIFVGCKSTDNNSNVQSSTNNSANKEHLYREHQELIATETSFDYNNMMRISIPEVGLQNMFIADISSEEKLFDDIYGRVYLLSDDRYGGSCMPCDNYIAILINGKLIVKDIAKLPAYFGDITLSDIDGDGDSEIILQETISITGGCGGYLSRVFDFKDSELIEMFSSIDENNNYFDTGYSITVLKNKKFIIKNRFSGYSEEFTDQRKTDDYYDGFWYDINGNPGNQEIMVDSFYEFSPINIDNDESYEVLCKQYVSLIGHADGLGHAKTILKYNKNSKQFEIIDTEFMYDSYE